MNVSIEGNLTASVPSYFAGLSQVVPNFQDAWKPFLLYSLIGARFQMSILYTPSRARVLKARGNHLTAAIRDEWFDFYKRKLSGQSEPAPRWRDCVAVLDGSMGELLGGPSSFLPLFLQHRLNPYLLGQYFVDATFTGTSQTEAENLMGGILGAMKSDLESLAWMDGTTKERYVPSEMILSPSL